MKNRQAISKMRASILIEVLLTITILAVGLTMVIRSYVAALRARSYSTDYEQAVILAENKLQEYIHKGLIESGLDERGFFPSPNSQFEYRLESREVASKEEPLGSLALVTCEILWRKGRRDNNISVSTYLFRAQKDEE